MAIRSRRRPGHNIPAPFQRRRANRDLSRRARIHTRFIACLRSTGRETLRIDSKAGAALAFRNPGDGEPAVVERGDGRPSQVAGHRVNQEFAGAHRRAAGVKALRADVACGPDDNRAAVGQSRDTRIARLPCRGRIDDGRRSDVFALRRIALNVHRTLQAVPDYSEAIGRVGDAGGAFGACGGGWDRNIKCLNWRKWSATEPDDCGCRRGCDIDRHARRSAPALPVADSVGEGCRPANVRRRRIGDRAARVERRLRAACERHRLA